VWQAVHPHLELSIKLNPGKRNRITVLIDDRTADHLLARFDSDRTGDKFRIDRIRQTVVKHQLNTGLDENRVDRDDLREGTAIDREPEVGQRPDPGRT